MDPLNTQRRRCPLPGESGRRVGGVMVGKN